MPARIGEFTVGQLVSLRFASDAEVPAPARKVLDEKLSERKAVKQLVKNWKPDYLRVQGSERTQDLREPAIVAVVEARKCCE
jgi:uncharacterized Fe-S cluster-containing MiaB family protein